MEKKKRGRKPKNVEKPVEPEKEKESSTKPNTDTNDQIPQIIHIKKSQSDELDHLTQTNN